MRLCFALLLTVIAGVAQPALARPVSLVCKIADMELIFLFDNTSLNQRSWVHATLIGNHGTVDVWMLAGTSALSFVEPLPTGVVQTTTVDLATGEAIHSRHTLIFEDFVPSQRVGRCERRE